MQQRLTVSEATRLVKQCLEQSIGAVWVEGEISNFVAHASGHFYFSLKDARAQLRCVMFRGANRRLRFLPADGMQCAALGRITVYEPSGQYQLIAERMIPTGAGELQLALERLKERLTAEGLFAVERKQALPRFPATVGVVTSRTGAAIRDIIHVLRRRWPPVRIILCPVRVQGAGAAAEIAGGIAAMDAYDEVEVMIVGRGGGSLEDLWAFNEEPVIRAVAACRTPVIAAVGHEVDVTLTDWVADQRAPTPSAAAEIAVRDRREVHQQLSALVRRCSSTIGRRVGELRLRLDAVARGRALQSPLDRLQQESQRADELWQRVRRVLEGQLARQRERLEWSQARIEALSPQAVLARGYAVTFDHAGRVVRRADAVAVGDRVRVLLGWGALHCRVEEREEDGNARGT